MTVVTRDMSIKPYWKKYLQFDHTLDKMPKTREGRKRNRTTPLYTRENHNAALEKAKEMTAGKASLSSIARDYKIP